MIPYLRHRCHDFIFATPVSCFHVYGTSVVYKRFDTRHQATFAAHAPDGPDTSNSNSRGVSVGLSLKMSWEGSLRPTSTRDGHHTLCTRRIQLTVSLTLNPIRPNQPMLGVSPFISYAVCANHFLENVVSSAGCYACVLLLRR